MQTKQTRVIWLDLLRVFAILAMVFLHTFTGNYTGADSAWRLADPTTLNWQILNLFDCLVRFCVPVFCMISGVFFLDPAREQPIKKLYSKNILRIAVSFIVWAGLYAVAGIFLRGEALGIGALTGAVKNAAFGHYHLWFLLMLIGFYMLVPFLRKIAADKTLSAYFILLCLVFNFLENAVLLIAPLANYVAIQSNKLSLGFVSGYVGYFMLGSHLYRYPPTRLLRRWLYAAGVAAFAVTAALVGLQGYLTGEANGDLYEYLLPNTLLEAVAVFLFFRARFENKTYSEKTVRVISFLSASSFGVYLTHDLFNMLLHRLGVTALTFTPLLSVPLLTVIVCGCAVLLTTLLRKIPVVSKYIL